MDRKGINVVPYPRRSGMFPGSLEVDIEGVSVKTGGFE